MPVLRPTAVLSSSSQDPTAPAENLLTPDPAKKWHALPGSKQGVALLQLERSSQIKSLDLGNDHSAFVEILVGRETAKSDEDYQVLLAATSLMSTVESRSGEKSSAVRMFSANHFTASVARQKWDRVKIVCTQPFNKNVPYGLAFIRFLDTVQTENKATLLQAAKEEAAPSPRYSYLGKFRVRDEEEEDEEDAHHTPILFASPSQTLQLDGTSDQTKQVDQGSKRPASPTLQLPSKISKASQFSVFYKPDEPASSSKAPRSPAVNKTPKASTSKAEVTATSSTDNAASTSTASKTPTTAKVVTKTPTSATGTSKTPNPIKGPSKTPITTTTTTTTGPAKTTPAAPTRKEERPFSRLLGGCRVVLSGYQNPERGQLRTTALALGGEYRPDWGQGCTHLICAVKGTPKYNQVKGEGKIVKKEWLLDCHRQRKRLSWRKYALNASDQDAPDSEEEILATPEDF